MYLIDSVIYTYRFTGVNIRQVGFEFLHSPVLVTVDGLVIVFLVWGPDDKGNGTVHKTLIHDSNTFVFDEIRNEILGCLCSDSVPNGALVFFSPFLVEMRLFISAYAGLKAHS